MTTSWQKRQIRPPNSTPNNITQNLLYSAFAASGKRLVWKQWVQDEVGLVGTGFSSREGHSDSGMQRSYIGWLAIKAFHTPTNTEAENTHP
jgi:hypothetical protein